MGKAERLAKLGRQIGMIVAEKNIAYGDAVTVTTEILKKLYPDGITPKQYQDVFLVVRIVDKLCRIANKKGAFDESPFMDIAGYGILGVDYDQQKDIYIAIDPTQTGNPIEGNVD